MHINIKPLDRFQTYETPNQAIQHVFINALYPKDWKDVHFGRDLAQIRQATNAIKAKDYSSFVALPRKGFWRVELRQA